MRLVLNMFGIVGFWKIVEVLELVFIGINGIKLKFV